MEFLFTALVILIELVAIYLVVQVLRGNLSILSKVGAIILLTIPIMGPLFFVWIRHWPVALPKHLDGHGAGIGRRYLDDAISQKAKTPSLFKKIEMDIMERQFNEQRKLEKRKRKELRWRKLTGKK